MPRRGENIHKRRDGRWEGRYIKNRDPNGKAHYASVYAKSYKEVKIKLKNASTDDQKEKLPYIPQKGKTFQEVLALWLDHNRLKLKGGTIYRYQCLIERHILPKLGDMLMTEITSSMINLFLNQKMKEGRLKEQGGLSPAYIRSIVIIITSAIQFAIKENMCVPLNTDIIKPALPKQDLIVLSLQEQLQLDNHLLNHLSYTNLGVYLSLHTGLRIGEVCALKWGDIDLDKGILHVRTTVARVLDDSNEKKSKWIIDVPKTQSSTRDIPISSDLLKILILMKRKNTLYVVSNCENFINPRTYEYRYHKILEQANIRKINYHVLRHTFATRCIEAGMDVKSLSEILGHANVSITLNTYVHSSLELKRKQLEKVSSLMNS